MNRTEYPALFMSYAAGAIPRCARGETHVYPVYDRVYWIRTWPSGECWCVITIPLDLRKLASDMHGRHQASRAEAVQQRFHRAARRARLLIALITMAEANGVNIAAADFAVHV